MSKISLSDMFPQKPEFTLARTGKTYRFRLFALSDLIWLDQTFGSQDEVNRVIKEPDWEGLAKICFWMLEDKFKPDFEAEVISSFNADGERIERKVTAAQKILCTLEDALEGLKMKQALIAAYEISSPLAKELKEAEQKKRQAEKREMSPKSTGLRSSTKSKVSTDGAMSTS